MKQFSFAQGSDEWREVRRGIPTASEFHRILTPAKQQLADGRWSYAYELVAERLIGEGKEPIDGLKWVERGKMFEPDAVQHYEFVHENASAPIGFIMTDDGRYGCSPDRILVDPLGLLEIKCPSPPVHIKYFNEGLDNAYKCQLQGSLLVTGFDFIDFQSFHPQLPEVYIRTPRDVGFIKKLQDALDQFCDEVDMVCDKVRAAGFVSMVAATKQPDDGWARMLEADRGLWAIG